jgi:hypothetical protein
MIQHSRELLMKGAVQVTSMLRLPVFKGLWQDWVFAHHADARWRKSRQHQFI